MGFLSRLFRPSGPVIHAPLSDAAKQAIMLLGMSGNIDGLAKSLRSKNPRVRAFTVEAVLFASQTRAAGGGQMQFSDNAPVDLRALRLLIPLLDDDDEQVRQAAERALVSIEKRSQFKEGAAQLEAASALAAYRSRRSPGAS